MYEAIHIQYCIKTLQLKSYILHDNYNYNPKKVKISKLIDIFKYKFSDNIISYIPENYEIYSDENILYNILQNAFKNAIKHCKYNGILKIYIEKIENNVIFKLINEPGKNHNILYNKQNENTDNSWLFKEDLNKLDIGRKDSTFKGLIDMKILSNAINSDINLNFNKDEVVFEIIFNNDIMIHIEECNENILNIQYPIKKKEINQEKLYFMGIDDQGISRIFFEKIAKELGVINNYNISKKNIKEFSINDEYLKILGKNPEEIYETINKIICNN